jgi:hypothetical protein
VLVAAFSRRHLGNPDVEALLACSASSARNYLIALLDAGIIEQVPRCAGHFVKPVYRLAANTRIDHAGGHVSRQLPGMGEFVNYSSDAGAIGVRRDPLVAALFGVPGLRK